MLVDDHAASLLALALLLGRAGYKVREATTVSAARTLVTEDPPDIVISDVQLMDGDGCDLFREVVSVFPSTCGIAVSGHDRNFCEDRCREAGFTLLLTKPVALDRLLTAIESCAAPSGGGPNHAA